jgi:hypothetical protein
MPRRKRTLSDYEAIDLQGRVDQGAQCELSPELPIEEDEETMEDIEPESYNICSCTRCALKPYVRKMSTIGRHLHTYGNVAGGPYEVRKKTHWLQSLFSNFNL